MKFALFLLALIPIAFAATIPIKDAEITEMISIDDIIERIKSLDLTDGCVNACEENVKKLTFLCTAACKLFFQKTL